MALHKMTFSDRTFWENGFLHKKCDAANRDCRRYTPRIDLVRLKTVVDGAPYGEPSASLRSICAAALCSASGSFLIRSAQSGALPFL
jgi:hypothetical protein